MLYLVHENLVKNEEKYIKEKLVGRPNIRGSDSYMILINIK